MSFANFFHPHDPALLALSVSLAVLASFVSLELAGRIKATVGRAQFVWLLAAGAAMGGGIWSMHFVAMIALELPFAVAYDGLLTAFSLLIAIFVATAGLYMVFWHRGAAKTFMIGGTLMGVGIAAMHYIGMAAVIMPAVAHYDLRLVAASVVIAIVASIVALWFAFQVEHFALKLASALLMGFAVSAMHFTGIAAFICGPADGAGLIVPGLSPAALATGVAGISGVIMLLGLALAFHDQRAKQRAWEVLIANESKRRIDALLRSATDLIAIVDRDWTVTYMSPIVANRLANGVAVPAVGMDFRSLLAPEARSQAGTLLNRALLHPDQPVGETLRGASDLIAEWFEITLNDQTADPAIRGIIVN